MTTQLTQVQQDTAAEIKSRPMAALIADVQALVGVFSTLLRDETVALRKADFKAVDALQAQKREFARSYHDLITGLYERREELAALPAAERGSLIDTRAHFTKVLDENLRALDAAKESTRRLVNKILDSARRTVVDDRKTHYSNSGKAQSYKTATLSLSIDQKL